MIKKKKKNKFYNYNHFILIRLKMTNSKSFILVLTKFNSDFIFSMVSKFSVFGLIFGDYLILIE